MTSVQGGCLCGDVRVIAHGAPKRVGLCHCLKCRKHHGAAFYAAAVFSVAAVSVTGTPHAYEGRHFCVRCGSSVFAQTGDEIEIHLGALDDPNQFTPTYQLWTKRREHWLPEMDNLISYDEDRTGD